MADPPVALQYASPRPPEMLAVLNGPLVGDDSEVVSNTEPFLERELISADAKAYATICSCRGSRGRRVVAALLGSHPRPA